MFVCDFVTLSPVLLHGLEPCPISNKQFKSLDFVLNGCFRKIFRTRSAEVVQNCVFVFNCMSIQECVAKRKCKRFIYFLQIMLNLIIYCASKGYCIVPVH